MHLGSKTKESFKTIHLAIINDMKKKTTTTRNNNKCKIVLC